MNNHELRNFGVTRGTCLLVLVFALGLAMESCSGSLAGQASAGQAPAGWVTHNDPAGFSVQVPRGWKVDTDAELDRIEIQGTSGERVEALPIFLNTTSLKPRNATEILQQIAKKFWSDTVWEPPQLVGRSALNQHGRSGNNMATSILTWISTPKGTAGTVFFLSAPEARYRQELETFARILETFSAFGPAEGEQASAPSLSFTRWQDPHENAFTVEVPDQWRVQGGLFRFTSIDVRSAVEAISPDGQVRVTLGDAEVPTFTVPNQMLTNLGFREGSWYSPGYNEKFLVRRYLPGQAFAKDYVMRQLSKVCSAPQILEERDRRDVSQSLNATYARSGLPVRVDAGEVTFTCQQAGQLKHGIYFASTVLVTDSSSGTGIWRPDYLYGYLASAGKQDVAQAALNKLIESFQFDPQWQQRQQNVTMNTWRIVTEAQSYISKTMSDVYWNKVASQDRISRTRSNATLGVTQVVDPDTEVEITVDNSKLHDWKDHGGNVVGTNSSSAPPPGYRELIRVP